MKVAGYVRVSTEEQARDGVSLDAQASKIKLMAELHGLDLAEIVVDAGESGKTLDRPGLTRVLAMLDQGEAEGVIVMKLDRLTRNLGDWSGLIEDYFGDKAGKSLMSVSESIDTRTAAGRMVLNIMMTVAQWERETIVERTLDALRHKQAKGERTGSVPFGSDLAEDGKTLVPNATEQSGIELIKALKDRPHRTIARILDDAGYKTKNGRPWRHSAIQRILKRVG